MIGSSKTLGDMFAGFRSEAFRLEALDDYSRSGGVEAYRAFLAGEEQPEEYRNSSWVTTVGEAVRSGRRMYRVHVLSRPLTDYLRFELSWGYRRNMAAGEEFFILDTTERENPLRGVPDFWLFDGEEVAVMNYDGAGGYLGADFYGGDRAPEFEAYRDAALAQAVPFADWWAEFGE
ncbi:hypothetical protein OU787_27205 [Kitasatospora sp. YST-16]|uniref:DUF6879 family protein n=1 Tax=unclassified Kitasatospora TaxID=2633591 RepID=UPI000D14709E|nr:MULTISPECIES: DUF6879 family protein [unclassified Kitasatospora]WAL74871.1 hypothetical protein OU787_27205 [Kitasatospora sp. YST-16]WNW40927.1 hypothetical protein RKE32_27140 [Streptomyces sp. Li-HN-5-13]